MRRRCERWYLNEKIIAVLLIACGIFGYFVGSGHYDEFITNNQQLIDTAVVGAAFIGSFVIWAYVTKWWLDEIDYMFSGKEKIDFCKFLIYAGYCVFTLGMLFVIEWFVFYFVMIIVGVIMMLVSYIMIDRCCICHTSEEHTTLKKAEGFKHYCDKCIEVVNNDFKFIRAKETE